MKEAEEKDAMIQSKVHYITYVEIIVRHCKAFPKWNDSGGIACECICAL